MESGVGTTIFYFFGDQTLDKPDIDGEEVSDSML